MALAFLLIFSLAATIFSVLLVRSFAYMSVRELKRQARAGNPQAKIVYPVRAYGMQLWIVLWGLQGLITSGIILILHSFVGSVWTVIISVPLIVLVHAILPWTRRPKPSLRLAAYVSPALERLLRILYPVLRLSEDAVGRWIQPEPILLIQSRDELLEILHHNAEEFDHVNADELKIAENALVFGDKRISDYMIPLSEVKFVRAEEALTPIVRDEIHKSGYSRLPVYKGNNQCIIGILYIKDVMNLKDQKLASEVMRSEVYYINELQSLDQALKAFIKTKHHLFIVVNEFEDIVGILTIEDVIEQIIGRAIVDEFDQYDDLRSVAKYHAKQKHDERRLTSA